MKRLIIGFLTVVFLGTLSYYIFQQILLMRSLSDKKNISIKKDRIENITQQREIIQISKDNEQKLFADYYIKIRDPMSKKLKDMCYRQFINIIKNKPSCSLEDLDVDSLGELNAFYEQIISGMVKVQDEVNRLEEMRLSRLGTSSPDKLGWMRYISRDKMYSVDYPMDLNISSETDEYISFEKKKENSSQNINSSIYIQKGYVYRWNKNLYPKLKNAKINETVENTGCDEPSFDSFCNFTRLADEYTKEKVIKVFTSEKISNYPNKVKLYLFVYEKSPGYMISLETDEKSTSKQNISYKEFKDVISTIKFLNF